jgi:ABC-2 type transport system permease protein
MRAEVFLETVRERRRTLMWWSLGILALAAIHIAFYPSVRDATALNEYGEDLPEALRALFTGGETDLVSGPGYLNSQIFALLGPLLLLILAIGFGANAIAGDEERGTLDLLLAQPVKRSELVWQRFLALAVLVTVATVVLFGGLALGAPLVDLEVDLGNLAAASVSIGLLALLYGAIAMAVGAIRPGRARAVAIATVLAVAAWILDGFGQAVSGLEPWRPISPYYQALGDSPLREGAVWGGWAILAAMTALAVATAILGLGRRDIEQRA